MAAIGPDSLVVIDEAGMADTLSLDRAIDHMVGRGGSVRFIGDDRQLSAIGAGGVLAYIEAAIGACRLTELLRFDDPAEAEASLALREGRAEALGYYLDQDRIHVGDVATMAHAVLDAWSQDHANGLDALMLAPTRDLVTELNRLAQRRHLEDHTMISRGAGLSDGTIAVAGDLVITRVNARQLPVGSRDWVKNGDRWSVAGVFPAGSMRVQSLRTKHTVKLPAGYVREWVDLGYATTIHGAQGLTADSMHGLATGEESRQELYTMLTRGRRANHLYLEVVGDGDPHALAHTDSVHLITAVERVGTGADARRRPGIGQHVAARAGRSHKATRTGQHPLRTGASGSKRLARRRRPLRFRLQRSPSDPTAWSSSAKRVWPTPSASTVRSTTWSGAAAASGSSVTTGRSPPIEPWRGTRTQSASRPRR